MKILLAVVLLFLICIVHRSAGSLGSRYLTAKGCCPNYSPNQVPKGRITGISMTPNICPRAIVITTVCNKEICMDPEWPWAKKVLNEFQESTANNTLPSAPFNVLKCNDRKKLKKKN